MGSITTLFRDAVQHFSTHVALIEPTEGTQISTLTYQALQERVHLFAGYLQQQQITKGERLMIWSASRADWLIAYFGALLVGMVVVPLDVNTKEDFLARVAQTTETTFLVTTQKQYHELKHPPAPLIDIDALPQGPLDMTQLPPIDENDLAELVFTSGTTGQPKGVMLSHHNIASNAMGSAQAVNIKSSDRALSLLPLSHMFEMTIELAIIHTGGSLVYARTLVPDTLLKLFSSQQVTCMVLVPQVLQLFLNSIEREVRRQQKEIQWEALHRTAAYLPFGVRRFLFSTVHKRFGGHFRFVVSGGASLPPKLAQRWEEMGFRVLHGYGATECAPVISVNPSSDHHFESVGLPLPQVEVRIAEDQEILVHGPNVALGYWKDPEATSASFKDGWYSTGDLGYLDAKKRLYLKGRKKNLIVLANGMNVYPEDVENVLQRNEAIKEAMVFGLTKPEQGPEVHAILLMNDPSKARAAVQQANRQLASHQGVRGFTIWPEQDFPRTHTLKVKRQDVLDKLQAIQDEHKP